MGIRIHKVLGYALTDLATEPVKPGTFERSVNDPRINPESPLLHWARFEEEDEDFEVPSLESYARWLDAQEKKADFPQHDYRMERRLLRDSLARKAHVDDLVNCAVFEREGAIPSALVLVAPVYLDRWYRSDDDIDYIEASLNPGPESTFIRELPKGIGVYSDRYMDASDGAELNEHAARFVDLARRGMPVEELDHLARHIRPADPREDRAPFEWAAEAAAGIVPLVPGDIRRLAAHGQVFTGPDVWKQLRPVLYTFWD